LLALERTRADSPSQSRADADDTAKQLQREMQAARLEGLRSVKEAQKRADQEAKDLLVLERERAVKASLTRAERAAVIITRRRRDSPITTDDTCFFYEYYYKCECLDCFSKCLP